MTTLTELGIYRKTRSAPRVQAQLPVRYGVASLEHSAISGDISEDGLYVATNLVLKIGSSVQVAIEFPHQTVHRTGEVIWAIQVPEHVRDSMVHGMGIRFIDADPDWAAIFREWRDGQSSDPA